LDNPKDWPLNIEGIEVVQARKYLVDPSYSDRRPAKVFNLCRSYRYQSLGYYVSLLAAARGHKPLPDVATIQDLKLSELVRASGHEITDVIQAALKRVRGDTFVLSVYFGQNIEDKYNSLALALFNLFPAPFLRAQFKRTRADDADDKGSKSGEAEGEWSLESVRTIAASEIPPDHFLFVLNCATRYFNRPHRRPRPVEARYDMAILHDPEDEKTPSNPKALKKFAKAAESMGFDVEVIGQDDYGRLAEFDALFIRATTRVNHYTFRFARRASQEGLVVIDDPDSIVKCSNKVYLAELLHRHRIATPPTLILHRDNVESAPAILGFPIVLKQPDSSFSLGVIKCDDREEYERETERLFKISDLLIAQGFMPTLFDWRVTIIDKEPLFVCKYFMAGDGKHWQIYDNSKQGDDALGEFETWPVSAAPPEVVKTALKAANLIGDGLYGVDIKESAPGATPGGSRAVVIEVNDNPNVDAGIEDKVLGDEVYLRIMRVFLKRLESRGR
jgi:glutathione synthase/RimK-type ligase-like ATP-grasp enzyme